TDLYERFADSTLLRRPPSSQKGVLSRIGKASSTSKSRTYFPRGNGGLVSFELHSSVNLLGFLGHLRVIILSTHLGDSRSLILPVAQTIYHEMGPSMRAEIGIDERLLRLSVGLEDPTDLQGDLDAALMFASGV